MSSGGIVANRSSSTDKYAHCRSIPNPEFSSFDTTETEIVKILATGKTLSTVDTQTLSGYEVSKVSDQNVNQILPVCYPPELIEQDAILASVYKNNTVHFDSSSTKLSKPSSDNNEVTLSTDNTSTSIYDTVIKVQTSIENKLTSVDETVEAIFDVTDVNAATQYAVNSQYNTKPNIINMAGADVYPTYIQEHSDYNTTKACGKNYTQYVSGIDASSGEPIWSNYDSDVTPLTNKFSVTDRVVSTITNDDGLNTTDFDKDKDFGIFKVSIALNEEPIKTALLTGSTLNESDLAPVTLVQLATSNQIKADVHIKNLPLFQETDSLSVLDQTKAENTSSDSDNSKFLLPSKNLTIADMQSLLNENNINYIKPNFSFKVEVDTSANSGYSFADSTYNLASIDDSELNDSLIYMKDWVNHPHSLSLSSGQLSLSAGTNGVQAVIDTNEITLAGGREKLTSVEAGHDGVIMINSNTIQDRATIAYDHSTSNIKVNVYYENDTIPSGLSRLSDELCLEPNVSFEWQKVIEETSQSTTKFKESAGTTLNLISNNKLLNNNYTSDAAKFEYNFNANQLPSDNKVELWKIKSGINLISQPSKFIDNEGNEVPGVTSSVILSNATQDFNKTNRELRQHISVKSHTDLHINQTFVEKGWSTFLSSNTVLESSTNFAYTSSDRLPAYNDQLHIDFLSKNSVNTMEYKIEYLSSGPSTVKNSLNDFCKISFQYSDQNIGFYDDNGEFTPFQHSSTSFKIEEIEMIQNVTPNTGTTIPVETPIDNSNNDVFTFKAGSGYTNASHYLTKVETVSDHYTSTFQLPLGQYSNYMVTTPLLKATTTYYNLRKKSDNSLVSTPNVRNTVMSRLQKNGLSSTSAFFVPTYRVVETVDPTQSINLTGMLDKRDLKEMLVSTQSKNTNTWNTISDSVDGTIYYHIENEPVINDINDSLLEETNNVETKLSFSNYVGEVYIDIDLNINKPYYTIPLVMDYKSAVFELKSFKTNINRQELVEKTTLTSSETEGIAELSSKVMNISNLYNVIKTDSWVVPSEYKIVSSINDNDVTIKVVKSGDIHENAIISIVINDNYIFVGEFLVSRITEDVIRMRERIGSTYNERFVNYSHSIDSFSIKDGFYVNKVNPSLLLPLGAHQILNLKKDNIAYNLVGNSLDSTQPISSLGPYQWISENNYSDTFSLTKYRGHGHSSTTTSNSVNQYYNIVRPDINATFAITNASNSTTLSQTFNNIYSGAVFTLDNLKRNVADPNPSNIGLKISFDYSMPNKIESRSKPVNVLGDTVTIKLENPSHTTGYTEQSEFLNPANYPKVLSLKDYSLFSFDGNSAYRYYNGPMRIRSSRVKLTSSNLSNPFSENSMVYSLIWEYRAQEVIVKTYRARLTSPYDNLLNYVGNPQQIALNTGSSWSIVEELPLEEAKNIGTNIGVHNIKLRNDVDIVNTTSYYVSTYPYYKYETMGIGNNITIPYNYTAGDFASNRVVKYMPNVMSLQDASGNVTPFTNITYSDMLKNYHPVINDSTNNLVNNMKLKIKSANVRKQRDLYYEPNTTKRHIKLFGSKMKIDLYKNNQQIKNVYNNYITSLVEDLSNNITLVSSEINSGIKFMIRQPISAIGYSVNETDAEYLDFYNTSDKTKWFPFKFTLTNVNMVSSEMQFNMLAGPGSYASLYTVKDVVSFSTPEVLYRRVYKYEDNTATDFDSVALKTTLTFSSRKYIDISVPSLINGNGFTANKFKDLLETISIPSIVWVDDVNFAQDIGTATYTLLYGNSTVSDKFRRDSFYTNNGETSFTLINYVPLMVMNNQIGMPLYSVQWNGFSKVPQISYETSYISPQRDSYLITESTLTTDLAKHSTLRLLTTDPAVQSTL